MNAPPLAAALLAAGPDALRCLFTEALPTRAVLLANLAAGWPDADAATHGPALDALLAAGHLLPSVSTRGRYRLASEVFDGYESRKEAVIKPPAPAPAIEIEPERLAPPLFSYFRGPISNPTPHAAITPAQLHTVLISPRHRAQTEALRAAPVGSPQRAELKKGLDYVTPAGTFARRANDALAEPSGLLVLDFDHVRDLAAARAALLTDAELAPELVLLFTSPSGDGLKALVRTDPAAGHLDNFRAYAAYLGRTYGPLGLTPDEAGKDVARACFVPYAPDAWLAPAYARTA
ncbi:BT4734/BF3469 family protein [Hymenobacter nivis]|uniref:BT4734-like N-terminal domain-containing protein n=1 Tax=Hymenobacter nivis TaxID=1850093 RepID=A0A2Z3GR37_9BACT|nr:BT4734/BF3469 family protein [Hymenobacter nivis]AWM34187.1 hypothetical protein DDQ68_16175 [Hymenobacter nivis]